MFSCDTASGKCEIDAKGTQSASACLATCTAPLFKCVSNKCIPVSTGGVSQAKCVAACGPSLRGVVTLE